MYAVNTTTSTLKSAGMTEVTSAPSPSCTVQGTYTNISCHFLWQTLNSERLLFFFFYKSGSVHDASAFFVVVVLCAGISTVTVTVTAISTTTPTPTVTPTLINCPNLGTYITMTLKLI